MLDGALSDTVVPTLSHWGQVVLVRFSNGVESINNSAYGIGILIVEPINSHENARSGCCRDFKDAAAANLIEGGKPSSTTQISGSRLRINLILRMNSPRIF